MGVQFFREVDYVAEGIELLIHLGQGKDYARLRESLTRKYARSMAAEEQKLALLERIEALARERLAGEAEELAYYFSNKSDADIYPGSLVLLLSPAEGSACRDAQGVETELLKMSESEYCERFGKLLQGSDHSLQTVEVFVKTSQPMDVISLLMKLELKDEDKWKLQTVFVERKKHQERALALLEQAVLVLREFEGELEGLLKEFFRYWEKTLENHGIEEYMREKIRVELGKNPFGYHLHAGIINFNAAFFQTEPDEKGSYWKPDMIRIGILFGENFDLRNMVQAGEEGFDSYVQQVLKLLSDKSKFEILSYTKSNRAYGAELAKRLNLTTATISHHMNTLLSNGLVELEKEENRLYYRTNTAALEEVLDYCKKVLT